MKKKYINPTMEVVKLQIKQQMLSSSPAVTNNDATQDVNGDYNDSRQGRGFWDDEEEY